MFVQMDIQSADKDLIGIDSDVDIDAVFLFLVN